MSEDWLYYNIGIAKIEFTLYNVNYDMFIYASSTFNFNSNGKITPVLYLSAFKADSTISVAVGIGMSLFLLFVFFFFIK